MKRSLAIPFLALFYVVNSVGQTAPLKGAKKVAAPPTQQQVYSSKKSYSAKEKAMLLRHSEDFKESSPKPNFYLDCKVDVENFCSPMHSADLSAVSCLETKFLLESIKISDKCFAAFKYTRHWLKTMPPAAYDEKNDYSFEQKFGLMYWPGQFEIPDPKPNYKNDCFDDETKICPQEPHGSTDAALCMREKFYSGAKISNKCFAAFRFFSRWIEETAFSYPQCVPDYNKYCRNESTGIGVSDCMMRNISKLNKSCAATIISLRPSVEKDRKARGLDKPKALAPRPNTPTTGESSHPTGVSEKFVQPKKATNEK